MNRSGKFERRTHQPEEIYGSVLVHRLICKCMRHGKKATSTNIVLQVLKRLSAETDKTPDELLTFCLQKIRPVITLRSKKIASSVYRIPVVIHPSRGTTIALNWLVKGARERKERGFAEKLYSELKCIMDNNKSVALKTKETYNKIADKNLAFMHFLRSS